MLNFDNHGLLTPNRQILSSLQQLEQEFVTLIPSNTRSNLFDLYRRYSEDLKTVCGGGAIRQWINGSFTTKKQDPRDIDFVTFIEYELIDATTQQALSAFSYPNSLTVYGVDAYIVIQYPVDHANHALFNGDSMYWRDHFDKTSPNRRGIKRPKGFLEIHY